MNITAYRLMPIVVEDESNGYDPSYSSWGDFIIESEDVIVDVPNTSVSEGD